LHKDSHIIAATLVASEPGAPGMMTEITQRYQDVNKLRGFQCREAQEDAIRQILRQGHGEF
jgi:hypothetical protein